METDEAVTTLLATDVAELSYEQARDGLAVIVQRLEEGSPTLEQSMQLWEKGEELARRCNSWLDQAQARLDKATSAADDSTESPDPEVTTEDGQPPY
jgi:exodeoxyribonuclease VII small subunit